MFLCLYGIFSDAANESVWGVGTFTKLRQTFIEDPFMAMASLGDAKSYNNEPCLIHVATKEHQKRQVFLVHQKQWVKLPKAPPPTMKKGLNWQVFFFLRG